MLLPNGGVIDDLIVYFLSDTWFRMVVNAGTRDKDWHGYAGTRRLRVTWSSAAIWRCWPFKVRTRGRSCCRCCSPAQRAAALELAPFFGAAFDSWFVARTGYTGEDGFEVMLPAADAAKTWIDLCAQGIRPPVSAREIPCGWKPA
jgi:aminomethyltransferase